MEPSSSKSIADSPENRPNARDIAARLVMDDSDPATPRRVVQSLGLDHAARRAEIFRDSQRLDAKDCARCRVLAKSSPLPDDLNFLAHAEGCPRARSLLSDVAALGEVPVAAGRWDKWVGTLCRVCMAGTVVSGNNARLCGPCVQSRNMEYSSRPGVQARRRALRAEYSRLESWDAYYDDPSYGSGPRPGSVDRGPPREEIKAAAEILDEVLDEVGLPSKLRNFSLGECAEVLRQLRELPLEQMKKKFAIETDQHLGGVVYRNLGLAPAFLSEGAASVTGARNLGHILVAAASMVMSNSDAFDIWCFGEALGGAFADDCPLQNEFFSCLAKMLGMETRTLDVATREAVVFLYKNEEEDVEISATQPVPSVTYRRAFGVFRSKRFHFAVVHLKSYESSDMGTRHGELIYFPQAVLLFDFVIGGVFSSLVERCLFG